MLLTLIIIFLLILANGFFVAAEIAIIASRKGRLEQLAEEGSRGAKLAMELAKDQTVIYPPCSSASRWSVRSWRHSAVKN